MSEFYYLFELSASVERWIVWHVGSLLLSVVLVHLFLPLISKKINY